jgi:hypothetical protein
MLDPSAGTVLAVPAATPAVAAEKRALVAASFVPAALVPHGKKHHVGAKDPSPPASWQCGWAPACAAAGRAYAALDRPAEAVAHMLMVGPQGSNWPPVPCVAAASTHVSWSSM